MTARICFAQECLIVTNPINRKESLESTHVGLNYLRRLYGSFGKEIVVTDDEKTFSLKIPYI